MEIEKDIGYAGIACQPSLPDSPVTGGRPYSYPFFKMEAGDSFFVPGDYKVAVNLRKSARQRGLAKNEKYMVRKVDGGARCWRLA